MAWFPGQEVTWHGFINKNLTLGLTQDIGGWALFDQEQRPGLPGDLFAGLQAMGDIAVPNYRQVRLHKLDDAQASEQLPQNAGMLTRGL